MNYETMSDFEVNEKLLELLAGGGGPDYEKHENGTAIVLVSLIDVMHGDIHNQEYHPYGELDYCNSWSDIGPLIEECGVSMLVDDIKKKCTAEYYADSFYVDENRIHYTSMNYKRAAAICIIKLLESKQCST